MKTNFRFEGPTGAPVVTLMHSLGATLELFDATAAALRDRYRVLRYDVRGHGASDVPPGPYTLGQMVDDLVALLREVAVTRTHVVGMSMGGLVAMQAAIDHPRLVDRLVLCDTTACYGEAVRPMWEGRLKIAETEGMTDALIDKTMEVWFTPAFMKSDRPTVDRVRAMLRSTDPRGYAAAIRAIGSVDLRDAIRAIRVPTLVVVGQDDPGTPPAMAQVIHEAISGARLLTLPGRHCAIVEHADRFNAEVRSFVGGARPAP